MAWDLPNITFSKAMPDDLVLLEALKSPAFYIGALGSRGNTAKRRERLALFDMSPAEIDRLHGAIGLDIDSKSPAESALSIVAEIIAVKNGLLLKQKKDGSAVPATKLSAPASPTRSALTSVPFSSIPTSYRSST